MRLLPRILLFGLLGLAVAVMEAGAYCNNYVTCDGTPTLHNWTDREQIPVFLDPNTAGRMRHIDDTPWQTLELQEEIKWVIHTINDAAGADIPHLYFAGLSAPCGSSPGVCGGPCFIPNAILIVADRGFGAVMATSTTTPEVGQVVSIEVDTPWDHWGAPSVAGGLLHELVHGLGLSHFADCRSPCPIGHGPCSVTDGWYGVTNELHHPYHDDIMGLRWLYGPRRPDDTRLHEIDNTNGDGWAPRSTVGVPEMSAQFGVSSASGPQMFVAYREPASRRPRTVMWDRGGSSWADWGVSFASPAWGQLGAALDAETGTAYSTFLFGEGTTSVNKASALVSHTSPTSRSIDFQVGHLTRRHGISAAFDPKTNNVIRTWRIDNGEIRLELVEGGSSLMVRAVRDGSGDALRAYATPSIACGDTGATENCILVWADPVVAGSGRHLHHLRSMHVGVFVVHGLGGLPPSYSFTFGPILSLPFLMESAPQVAFREDVPGAFVVTWIQSFGREHVIWSLAKPVDPTVSWTVSSLASHGSYPTQVYSGIGSADGNGELLILR